MTLARGMQSLAGRRSEPGLSLPEGCCTSFLRLWGLGFSVQGLYEFLGLWSLVVFALSPGMKQLPGSKRFVCSVPAIVAT